MKKKLISGGLLAAGVAVAVAVTAAAPAQADPFRQIVAVGSNTTEALYNAFGNGTSGYTPNGFGTLIASYDSTGTATIETHSGGPAFTRPNGSGDGRKALSAAWDSSNHTWSGTTLSNADVTISRSSSKAGVAWVSGSSGNQESFIPMGRDAVGVAVKNTTTTIPTLKLGAIEAIFGAANDTTNSDGSATASAGTYTQVAGSTTVGDVQETGSGSTQTEQIVTGVSPTTTITVQPRLPQTSSGTRSFFLSAIGASTTLGAWVGLTTNEENTASWLNANDIVPFSGAAAVAQKNGRATDTGISSLTFPKITSAAHGGAGQTLVTGTTTFAPGTLYGSSSTKPSYVVGDFTRDVYTVVPTSQLSTNYTAGSTTHTLQVVVDTDLPGLLDGSGNTIVSDFGFKDLTTAYRTNTTNWFQNTFEH